MITFNLRNFKHGFPRPPYLGFFKRGVKKESNFLKSTLQSEGKNITLLSQDKGNNIRRCAAITTENFSENKEFRKRMKTKGAIGLLTQFLRSILPEEGKKVSLGKIQTMKVIARALSGLL